MPLYIGLVLLLILVAIKFFEEFVHLTDKLVLLVVIHVTFLVSAIMLAYVDRLTVRKPDVGAAKN